MSDNAKYKIDLLIDEQEIAKIVESLATKIMRDFDGEEVVLIGVLNGAYVFLNDLTRALYKMGMRKIVIDFMAIDTYGDSMESSHEPKITKDLKQDIRDKNVVLVEDIVDTGFSLSILQAMLRARLPRRLATAAMLSKDARREIEVPIDYIGKHIPDKFVLGYGLDYEGRYHRELPYIGAVSFN